MSPAQFFENFLGRTGNPIICQVKSELVFRHKETREVTLTIPVGSKLQVYFIKDNHSHMGIEFDNQIKVVSILKAAPKLSKFTKIPSVKSMENWISNGVAKTVLGGRIEPDGCDSNFAPSWLLTLGYI